ncbi:hypothetical protein GW17_00037737 [Ensete ventricosum]|nr:hypothetical protein GW17_00037737 [Ensete ventricosum]
MYRKLVPPHTFSMSSYNSGVTFLLILFLSVVPPSLRAKKLLGEGERKVTSSAVGLALNIRPRGITPPPYPRNVGNGATAAGSGSSNRERMLGSVPSPGIGH